MFFLNLSVPEFLTLLTAVSGVVVALYLLSRARRRQVVPTLRFWVHAAQPVPSSRRRRIQQPWSLILQLICLALLLLAISQLKLGNREQSQRAHVLLLDSSSWMGARARTGTLLDEAKARARGYVRSLPASDRVMVVRVDGLPSPVTAMESNREAIERAIDETRPGASALNLQQAFLFAEQIRRQNKAAGGEVVYAGAGRVAAGGSPMSVPGNLRVLAVEGPRENVGLARVGARRSDASPEVWDIFVSVHNHGPAPKRVPVSVQFGGAQIGATLLDVKPRSTQDYTFQYRTRTQGWIEARILAKDALEDDNRAIVELPELKLLDVAVYSNDPDAIRPMLAAHSQVRATYRAPSEYKAGNGAQVVIADGFNPVPEPTTPAIYIEPAEGSVFRTRSQFSEPRTVRWRPEHEITSGIRTRDQRLPSGHILSAGRSDVVLGEVDGGAVALVRPEKRAVALGFHPGRTDLKFDLTTPLLLANVLRWMEPASFRTAEVHGGSVGTVTASLEKGSDMSKLRVVADGQDLPYSITGNEVKFFSGSPGVVRVISGNREQVYSLSLPEIGDREWEYPAGVKRGTGRGFSEAVSRDLWQTLAIAGTLGLLAEWLIFGRSRARLARQTAESRPEDPEPSWRKAS